MRDTITVTGVRQWGLKMGLSPQREKELEGRSDVC